MTHKANMACKLSKLCFVWSVRESFLAALLTPSLVFTASTVLALPGYYLLLAKPHTALVCKVIKYPSPFLSWMLEEAQIWHNLLSDQFSVTWTTLKNQSRPKSEALSATCSIHRKALWWGNVHNKFGYSYYHSGRYKVTNGNLYLDFWGYAIPASCCLARQSLSWRAWIWHLQAAIHCQMWGPIPRST